MAKIRNTDHFVVASPTPAVSHLPAVAFAVLHGDLTGGLMYAGNRQHIRKGTIVIEALRLASIVARLGASSRFDWWPADAGTSVGVGMMQRIFPRTAEPSALDSVMSAACRAHDLRVGNLGVYHLFRLPGAEARTTGLLIRTDEAGVSDICREVLTMSEDELLASLENMASTAPSRASSGPVLVQLKDLTGWVEALPAVASFYFAGFRDSIKTYPYFRVGE